MTTYEMEPVKTNVDRAGDEFAQFIVEWEKKWEHTLDIKTNISIELTDRGGKSHASVDIRDLKDRVAEKKSKETMAYMPEYIKKILSGWFK